MVTMSSCSFSSSPSRAFRIEPTLPRPTRPPLGGTYYCHVARTRSNGFSRFTLRPRHVRLVRFSGFLRLTAAGIRLAVAFTMGAALLLFPGRRKGLIATESLGNVVTPSWDFGAEDLPLIRCFFKCIDSMEPLLVLDFVEVPRAFGSSAS